ncbi:hypothetical protein [Tessaracoccus flavescens]|uniref:hypothetical protein n=1 Tax=Tessaracoccus flavescens TaxID=399497 RepID=UPI0012601C7D|nr:hypothetical protein [Tessaracoccus flavescens]
MRIEARQGLRAATVGVGYKCAVREERSVGEGRRVEPHSHLVGAYGDLLEGAGDVASLRAIHVGQAGRRHPVLLGGKV